jgi:hypothetical protein
MLEIVINGVLIKSSAGCISLQSTDSVGANRCRAPLQAHCPIPSRRRTRASFFSSALSLRRPRAPPLLSIFRPKGATRATRPRAIWQSAGAADPEIASESTESLLGARVGVVGSVPDGVGSPRRGCHHVSRLASPPALLAAGP